ncbi:HAD family hydrolase [Lutibacter sp. TH_r2]|uniref:HAD family hydrolase n=1 Tax=Lutibacter sp. TH_r2 TaxID=3082083 RepID=UPI002955AFB2|nr:HAD family hydrolase [Lutibacter sp. TH_r2]MDV7187656.1 HAD family hydrolase [Lutibacter sp. TH_r2]
MKNIKVIAFDADDTLWVNEPYFRETEQKFAELLKEFLPEDEINKELFKVEIKNLSLYGYGIKGFMLSMIETASKITNGSGKIQLINKIIKLGKQMLNKPIELLDGVEQVLKSLNGDYRLVLATKGDLLDQERKLIKSGLEKHFHHIEIMSDKKSVDYKKLLKHLDCKPEHFLMIGNSVKSDVLPVLKIGAKAVHVPFHTTWSHEEVNGSLAEYNYLEVENISEISKFLK